MEVFADDNFKFSKNDKKLTEWVENTVGKGEIARYEQFLLLPQCFQNACLPGVSKGVIVWEWVNTYKKKALNMKMLQKITLEGLTASYSRFWKLKFKI